MVALINPTENLPERILCASDIPSTQSGTESTVIL